MIEAVFLFAVCSALFEAIVVWKMVPRWMLMSTAGGMLIHLIIIGGNMYIHFGTVTGTMTAIVAGLASFAVLPIMRRVLA